MELFRRAISIARETLCAIKTGLAKLECPLCPPEYYQNVTKETLENRAKRMKRAINSYFDMLSKSAQEMRKNNNPVNDAEIISGRYKNDILKIIEKYFPGER